MAISPTNQIKIDGAIGSLNLIRMLYSKKKKPDKVVTERVVRVVEPYEIKDGYLYAWDTTKDKKIKTFILDNISNDDGKAFPTYEAQNPPDARKMRPTVNTTAFV